MAEVSSNYAIRGAPVGTAKVEDPAASLRRLDLSGRAGGAWADVIQLDATGLATAARTIDAERDVLQRSHEAGQAALGALALIDEKLAEATDLAAANAKAGTSRDVRRANQRRIDALLDEVGNAAADAGTAGARVLDGSVTLVAGDDSLPIERVSLATLGRVSVNGRAASLKDVRTREPLDTARRRRSTNAAARRSLDEAGDTVKSLRARVETFLTESVRPRVADVAVAMEGLFENTAGRLTGTEDALIVARELRKKMLSSATAATIVGAEGWNRERLLGLLS